MTDQGQLSIRGLLFICRHARGESSRDMDDKDSWGWTYHLEELDAESFKIFRREAARSNRMTESELNISNAELLSKLHIMKDGKLKRSAVLFFL